MVKNPPADAGNAGLIPWSGRSPGEENGNRLQYFCLENSMDRGVWWAIIHGVAKRWTQFIWQTTHKGLELKVMLKVLQARLQLYVDWELPEVQAGFRKGRETRDQIANIYWITEKAREFQKKSTSASLTKPKPLTVWITTNYGKFLKRWEYQTTLPTSCQQGTQWDMEQRNGSEMGKDYVKAVYCHPAYLTYEKH